MQSKTPKDAATKTHRRSRSGKCRGLELSMMNNILTLNHRLLYMSTSQEEVRRRQVSMQSLQASRTCMRVQETLLVGKRWTKKNPEGGYQRSHQKNKTV